MGYRSDVRITTTTEGYKELNKFINSYLAKANEKDLPNLLDCTDINENNDEYYYLGWDWLKWYESMFEDVIAVMDGLKHLEDLNISYSYLRIGEEAGDVDQWSYEGNDEAYCEVCRIERPDDAYNLSAIGINREPNNTLDSFEEGKFEIVRNNEIITLTTEELNQIKKLHFALLGRDYLDAYAASFDVKTITKMKNNTNICYDLECDILENINTDVITIEIGEFLDRNLIRDYISDDDEKSEGEVDEKI